MMAGTSKVSRLPVIEYTNAARMPGIISLRVTSWATLRGAAPATIAASSSEGSMLRKMPTVKRKTTPTPRMASTKIMPVML